MKYLRCHAKAVSLLSGILLLFVSLSAGAQSFTLEIPDRTPSPPTAKVKLTLITNSSVAGSTITIGGTTVSLPVTSITPLANGDALISAKADSTGNNVVLVFSPISQLTPGTFCSAVAAGWPHDVTIVFNGPTLAGYRMTSYSVDANPSASPPITAIDCSHASVRESGSAAFLKNLPVSVTNLGRQPMDIILVLDESGSMAWLPPGDIVPPGGISCPPGSPFNPAPTRWQVLCQSVQSFVGTWENTDLPSVNLSSDPIVNDRLGLVFYNTNPDSPDFGGGSIFVARGNAPPGPSHQWTKILTEVNKRGPGGWTAMGPGLQTAIQDWQNDPQNDAYIVLMTDGIQNQPPCVVPQGQTGCNVIDGGAQWQIDGAGNPPLHTLAIPIQTVGMGTASGVPYDVLDGISNETAAIHEQTDTSQSAGTTFADTLVKSLEGNTLKIVTRTSGAWNPSNSPSPQTQFWLDGSVKRAIFTLTWQGAGQGALDLSIIPPGGCTLTSGCHPISPASRTDGSASTVQAIDIPASGPIGQWTLQVVQPILYMQRARAAVVATTTGPNLSYQLSVYSVEGRLNYRLSFPAVPFGTGDGMVLAAEMSYDGKPLIGLGGSMTVEIQRPNVGLGTILHNTDVPDSVLNNEPDPTDPTVPYERKVLYLSKTANLVKSIEPQPIPNTYVLRDDGNQATGDIKADDGVYTAKFADTSVPGLYTFTVTMDWDNPSTGKIHRTATIQKLVKVNPDPTRSIVTAAKGTTAGAWLINVDPVDKFGNYVGPGYGSAFQVQVTGGGSASLPPADTRQTGKYGISLTGVPAGADPVVTITVSGKEIRHTKISKLKGNCDGLPFGTALLYPLGGIFLVGVVVHRPLKKKGLAKKNQV